jgi:hypothetical protein
MQHKCAEFRHSVGPHCVLRGRYVAKVIETAVNTTATSDPTTIKIRQRLRFVKAGHLTCQALTRSERLTVAGTVQDFHLFPSLVRCIRHWLLQNTFNKAYAV